METGDVDIVSVSSEGAPGNATSGYIWGDFYDASVTSISADGRYVAFSSSASNLVEVEGDDTNGLGDVFVHDRLTHATTRVSVDTDEEEGVGPTCPQWGCGPLYGSSSAVMDGTGRYVAFTSDQVLDATDDNGDLDIYLRDLVLGTTRLISRPVFGSAWYYADDPAISADGSQIAFYSVSETGAGYQRGVYVVDTSTGNGVLEALDGYHPALSATGDIISYEDPSGLVREDRVTGYKQVIDGCPDRYNDHGWRQDSMSADGDKITFWSKASNIVEGDEPRGPYKDEADVFLWDAGISASTPAQCSPDPSAISQYVAFGDSITTGYSALTCVDDRAGSKNGCSGFQPATPYPNLVADGLSLSPFNLDEMNRVGIWGSTAEEAAKSYDAGTNAYDAAHSDAGSWEPQLIAVGGATQFVSGALGINDMQFNDVPHWMQFCLPPEGSVESCEYHAAAHIAEMDPYLDRLFYALGRARLRGVNVAITLYYNPMDSNPGPDAKEGCEITQYIADVILDALNDELTDRALQGGLAIADPRGAFDGHGAGSDDPYVFGSTCSDLEAMRAIPSLAPGGEGFKKTIGILYDPHPRTAGAEAIGEAVLTAFGR